MFSICRCLNSRNRVEGDEDSKPDFIEWSILSGLCLLNNNILQTIAAPEIEQNTVNRLSVSKNYMAVKKTVLESIRSWKVYWVKHRLLYVIRPYTFSQLLFQESLVTILRLKLMKDKKRLADMAAYIHFLCELRCYSDESMKVTS